MYGDICYTLYCLDGLAFYRYLPKCNNLWICQCYVNNIFELSVYSGLLYMQTKSGIVSYINSLCISN